MALIRGVRYARAKSVAEPKNVGEMVLVISRFGLRGTVGLSFETISAGVGVGCLTVVIVKQIELQLEV